MKLLYYTLLLLMIASTPVVATSINRNNCTSTDAIYDKQQKTLNLSTVSVDRHSYTAHFDFLNTLNPFHFQLTHLKETQNETTASSFDWFNQTLTLKSLCVQSTNGGQSGFKAELQAIPNSNPMQFLLKSVNNPDGKRSYNWEIEGDKGALLLLTHEAFKDLAVTQSVSGAVGVNELKFIIVDVDSNTPILFFINSKKTPFHYEFIRQVLNRYKNFNYSRGSTQFLSEAYFKKNRLHLAGSIIYYDHYKDPEFSQQNGLYTLGFWPTDPVPAHLIEQAYLTIKQAMPFIPIPLAYHPVGDTQEQHLTAFTEQFAKKNIRIIHTDALFSQLDSAILNKGEAYGRLKIILPGDQPPSEDIIAIYTFTPNTLGHVGGIITEQPQTPLSHINLKARQNNTPNAYIKNVRTNEETVNLINQWVHYSVTDEGVKIEPSTEAEALKWLADKLPSEITIPKGDLTLTAPMPLTDLEHNNWIHVGVKAANVAELGKILTDDVAPSGYALPFALYDTFMGIPRCKKDLTKQCNDATSLSLYTHIENLLVNTEFIQNQQVRQQRLQELRNIIEAAKAPQNLIDQIETVRLFWEPKGEPFKQKLRVRSSTNNEDLEGFNGAGLYDSFTHKPKEGKLINSIKQVWASLWNLRAFEERRLHRIDHLKTYMGVLIHPNYGDEQANGVAITKNIYNPDWKGFYINAQYGELSITNPEPIETETGLKTPIPDEFIITHLPASTHGFAWETLFIRHSTIKEIYGEPVKTKNVLTDDEVINLRENLQLIHQHFKNLYQGDKSFAMDIEFKITETENGNRGQLAIKQARPWID